MKLWDRVKLAEWAENEINKYDSNNSNYNDNNNDNKEYEKKDKDLEVPVV